MFGFQDSIGSAILAVILRIATLVAAVFDDVFTAAFAASVCFCLLDYLSIVHYHLLFTITLNGDNVDDAVVALDFHAPGTTGHFRILAIVVNQDGEPYNLASVAMGDRTVIESISTQSGEVTVNAIVHGPDDALCCPSMQVTWKFKLAGDEIIWLSDDVPQSVQDQLG